MQSADLLSREIAAGYDLNALGRGPVLMVGVGATGNNVAQALVLSGVRDLVFVDPDVVDPSNLARSPLFVRSRQLRSRRRKAREVLLGARELAVGEPPRLRYAEAQVQEFGLGLLADAAVVVSCVDNVEARAWLASATRLVGVPLVDVGIYGSRGQVAVFPNHTSEEPCWLCAHSDVEAGGVSCAVYARAAVEAGFAPATQTVAGALGCIAAEATIQALHGKFPLSSRMLHVDVRTGGTSLHELSAEPTCPGAHRLLDTPVTVPVGPKDRVRELFGCLPADWTEPRLILLDPFVVSLPCPTCSRPVAVRKPSFNVRGALACAACGRGEAAVPAEEQSPGEIVTTFGRDHVVASLAGRHLGLGPGAIVEAWDTRTHATTVLRLAGAATASLHEIARRGSDERNAEPPRIMNGVETDNNSPPAPGETP